MGGLAGAAAKVAAEKLLPPRTQGQTPPPQILARQAAAAVPFNVPELAQEAAAKSGHWVFGAIAGGLYGIVVEYRPKATAWHGIAFGLTLNRLMHKGFLPGVGAVEPEPEQPFQERLSEWVTHAIYGAATESVRRAARKRL